jgi:hypothetical protein
MKPPIHLLPDSIADALRADLLRPAVVVQENKVVAADDGHVAIHPPHPPHADPPGPPQIAVPPFPPGSNNTLRIANEIARRQWEEERNRSTRAAIQNALHQRPNDLPDATEPPA